MATQADIKRLLSKKLTGLEAAKLILQDNVEVDHGRDGLLSKADIERIKRGLTSPKEIDDYNRWIRVYQLVDYTLKEARITQLEAERMLTRAIGHLQLYHQEAKLRSILWLLPAIVTEKQYQELKAKQRARLLAEKISLHGAAISIEDEEEEDGYPLQRALQRLLALIRSGQLRPVLLSDKAIQQLKDLEEEQQAERERSEEHPDLPDEDFWSDAGKRKKQILETAYPAGRMLREDELSLLEQISSDEPTAEQYHLLDSIYCSRQELYDAGLQRDWIDEYKPDLDEETSARPAGMKQSPSLAIIQDPSEYQLDERGWYKDSGTELLSKLSDYDYVELFQENLGRSLPEQIKLLRQQAGERIKVYLAIQAMVEAVSEIIGVQLGEDLDQWTEELQATLGLYNLYAAPLEPENEIDKRLPSLLDPLAGLPKLPRLKIGKLKPTASSMAYYRERMAMALGDDWWREGMDTLDFQAQEEDSLAATAATLLKEMAAARKERSHGS